MSRSLSRRATATLFRTSSCCWLSRPPLGIYTSTVFCVYQAMHASAIGALFKAGGFTDSLASRGGGEAKNLCFCFGGAGTYGRKV